MNAGLAKILYDIIDDARRGGGIQGGVDYTARELESVVEETRVAAYQAGFRDGQRSTKPDSLEQLLEDDGS